jgi:hypothetical protein
MSLEELHNQGLHRGFEAIAAMRQGCTLCLQQQQYTHQQQQQQPQQYTQSHDDAWRQHIKPSSCMKEDDVLFLFVLHGGNVSADYNYHPFDTKIFEHIFMYARPKTVLYISELSTLDFMSAHYTQDRTINNDSTENTMYIPPLLYSLADDDLTNYLIGLYKLSGNQYGPPTIERLMDYETLKLRPEFQGKPGPPEKNSVIISHLTGMVNEYIKSKRITFHRKPSLGIASCQVDIKKYTNTQPQPSGFNPFLSDQRPPAPRNEKDVKKRNFLDMKFLQEQNKEGHIEHWDYVPTIVPLDETWETKRFIHMKDDAAWNAYATQTSIGCGMNVLGYLDLIEDSIGRQKVCALNEYGTSIFKLYDYYYNKYESILERKDSSGSKSVLSQFMIVRSPLKDAIKCLCETLLNHDKDTYGIMFKIYHERQNEKGHAVILLRWSDKIIFIDPQLSIKKEIEVEGIKSYEDDSLFEDASIGDKTVEDTVETIYNGINSTYKGNEFTKAEICLTIRQKWQDETTGEIKSKFAASRMPISIKLLLESVSKDNTMEIKTRNMNVNTGGMNKKSKKKSKNKKSKNKKSKNKIKTQIKDKKKRKTKKKYQRGGDDDKPLTAKETNELFIKLANKDTNIDTSKSVPVSSLSSNMRDQTPVSATVAK